MKNEKLKKLLVKYVESKDDTSKDEWYYTEKGFAELFVEDFIEFMRSKGVMI